jgi:tetratricopeptide (TPR) repeat protein
LISQLPELETAWKLLSDGRSAEARDAAARVLTRYPGNLSAVVCHAMANWKAEGDIALSLEEMRRAAAAAPNVASIRHNLGTLLMSNGEIDAATAEFREAMRIKPDDTVAFQSVVQNIKFTEETDLVREMVALHARGVLDKARREYLAFGLAKVFDDLNMPERAMAYAMEANALVGRPFDLAGEEAALAELRELGRLDAFRRSRGGGHPSRALLLIVGMPRAGTTLVETILARHPDVLPLGESGQFPNVERSARQRRGHGGGVLRHELALSLDKDWLAAQAEEMVRGWTARAAGGPLSIVTDKLPENAVRLGLVSRLFPHARVVHVRRHPLDVGVSNFFQRFSDGQGFSNRLDWIGRRTRQTADSMAIWKRALDLPALDVSYERLVAEPETEARRIAEFAGLEWTDAMLAPDRDNRPVHTASVWQVRQPIYTTAVARWRRYEPWLGPMIEAMGGMAWVEQEAAAISG